MSQIVMAFEDVPNPELRMFRHSDGILHILGTTKGNSLILQIDLLEKKVKYWAFYSLSEGSLSSQEKEEVSAMKLFRGYGNILALADGRVIMITNH